jgi:radical SAM superfamily enzyme YgiQ (UPF0313 family)
MNDLVVPDWLEAQTNRQKKATPLDVLFVNLPTISPELATSDDATSAVALTPPLGLLYLANSIKDSPFVNSYQCVDFAICDFTGCSENHEVAELVLKKLKETATEKPRIFAVALMFSSAYGFFQLVIEEIKKCWKDTVIMVGGVHASNTVEYLLKNNPGIDYITCGEGEVAFNSFIEMIATDTSKDILGVHSQGNIKRKSDNRLEQTAYTQNLNIDYTKYPDLLDMGVYTKGTSLFSLSKTTLSVRAFSIMASRGCPYHCTFCASHTVHGRTPRWRSFQNVTDEIYWLNATYGVRKFYLIDDNYVPSTKAVELFNMLSEIDIEGFEIVIQNMSINATDHKIIDAIVKAGINNIAFAIESGSVVTQKRIKKNVKLNKAHDLVRYSQSKGLNVRIFYIIGFPRETVADMEETFQYAKSLGADWSTFSVASPIPGTEMYSEFVELGYIEDGPSSWTGTTIRDRVFDTKEISREAIKDLAYRANLDSNFINNIHIKNCDFENAETIFSNFIEMYDFHIFAHDCLRRVYKSSGDTKKESNTIETMKMLLKSNETSRSFRKYFDLLDDEIVAHLG